MANDYLHGVETIDTGDAPSNVSEVATSIIGIVGTANPAGKDPANWKVNVPVVLLKQTDIELLAGINSGDHTLPKYLPKIYQQFSDNVPVIILINVLPLADVAAAEFTKGVNDTINLGKTNICGVVVTNSAGAVTYVEDDDYEVDYETGIVTILDDALTTVKIAYKYGDLTAIDEDDFAGVTTPERTGVYALIDAQTATGFTPKIIGAPGFAHNKDVGDALVSVANELKARCYIDADTETNDTVSEIIAARAVTEDVFIIHEKRANLLFPALMSGGVEYPMSVAAMGVRSRTDMDPSMGYHHSISSQKINGFDGISIPVQYSINNKGAESQLLNGAGIVTVKNVAGLKFCGNENSSFDRNNTGNTDHERFETTMTTGDVIEMSIELSSEDDIDKPMTSQFIRKVVRKTRAFLRRLKARGAIAGGTCWYKPSENDPADLAQGEIMFNTDDAATPPVNRLTFQRSYNADYFASLGGE